MAMMIGTRAAYIDRFSVNKDPSALIDNRMFRLLMHSTSQRSTQTSSLPLKDICLTSSEGSIRLPSSFTPSNNDVIIGTGRDARNHVGNASFMKIIRKYSDEYSTLTAKKAKGTIITKIIRDATKQSPTGTPFVKRQNGHRYTADHDMAREKVSQSMRNLLHNQYKSSTTAKKHKRVQNYRYFDAIIHVIMQTRGNFITARIGPLYAQTNENSNKTDEEIYELFTQANLDILESLKSLLREKGRGTDSCVEMKE